MRDSQAGIHLMTRWRRQMLDTDTADIELPNEMMEDLDTDSDDMNDLDYVSEAESVE